jgi:hypothetical protein
MVGLRRTKERNKGGNRDGTEEMEKGRNESKKEINICGKKEQICTNREEN